MRPKHLTRFLWGVDGIDSHYARDQSFELDRLLLYAVPCIALRYAEMGLLSACPGFAFFFFFGLLQSNEVASFRMK